MNRVEQLRKIIVEMFAGKQSDFAVAISKQPQQVNHWLNGYRNIGNGLVAEIEDKLNLPRGWFDSQDDLPKEYELPEEMVMIEYLDITAVCGTPCNNGNEYPEIISQIAFSKDKIQDIFGMRNTKHLRIIGTNDDSMAPTIPKGSAIFIDESIKTFEGDGIYVFFYIDTVYLKRLQRLPTGLKALSDNPLYGSFHIDNPDQFHIAAKYVGLVNIQLD